MARSLLKYSIAELTVEEGIAKSKRPKIYNNDVLDKRGLSYTADKRIELSFNYCLHNFAVYISQPYGKECTDY